MNFLGSMTKTRPSEELRRLLYRLQDLSWHVVFRAGVMFFVTEPLDLGGNLPPAIHETI